LIEHIPGGYFKPPEGAMGISGRGDEVTALCDTAETDMEVDDVVVRGAAAGFGPGSDVDSATEEIDDEPEY
jgi:hypothetical protein